MKIYEVLYNDFIYESSDSTYSIHKSKKGAVKEMIRLKIERWNDLQYDESFERFKYRINKLRD